MPISRAVGTHFPQDGPLRPRGFDVSARFRSEELQRKQAAAAAHQDELTRVHTKLKGSTAELSAVNDAMVRDFAAKNDEFCATTDGLCG